MLTSASLQEPTRKGQVIQRDVSEDYVKHCLSFIDVASLKPLKVAADAGNGMAGMILPRVFGSCPARSCRSISSWMARSPITRPALLSRRTPRSCAASCRREHCDMGVAFDGDADRMFLVDEQGDLSGGDMVTALVAQSLLKRKHPGATILYNLICLAVACQR